MAAEYPIQVAVERPIQVASQAVAGYPIQVASQVVAGCPIQVASQVVMGCPSQEAEAVLAFQDAEKQQGQGLHPALGLSWGLQIQAPRLPKRTDTLRVPPMVAAPSWALQNPAPGHWNWMGSPSMQVLPA